MESKSKPYNLNLTMHCRWHAILPLVEGEILFSIFGAAANCEKVTNVAPLLLSYPEQV